MQLFLDSFGIRRVTFGVVDETLFQVLWDGTIPSELLEEDKIGGLIVSNNELSFDQTTKYTDDALKAQLQTSQQEALNNSLQSFQILHIVQGIVDLINQERERWRDLIALCDNRSLTPTQKLTAIGNATPPKDITNAQVVAALKTIRDGE